MVITLDQKGRTNTGSSFTGTDRVLGANTAATVRTGEQLVQGVLDLASAHAYGANRGRHTAACAAAARLGALPQQTLLHAAAFMSTTTATLAPLQLMIA